jgi:hypothetical protein
MPVALLWLLTQVRWFFLFMITIPYIFPDLFFNFVNYQVGTGYQFLVAVQLLSIIISPLSLLFLSFK